MTSDVHQGCSKFEKREKLRKESRYEFFGKQDSVADTRTSSKFDTQRANSSS